MKTNIVAWYGKSFIGLLLTLFLTVQSLEAETEPKLLFSDVQERFGCVQLDQSTFALAILKGNRAGVIRPVRPRMVRRLRNRLVGFRHAIRLNLHFVTRRDLNVRQRRRLQRMRARFRIARRCNKIQNNPDMWPTLPADPNPDPEPNPEPTPEPEAPVISLEVSKNSCVAPCPIFFDASGTTSSEIDEPFHQLFYSWDMGNPDSGFVNRQDVDPNRMQGPIAAHVYEEAGTYTVKLDVTDHKGGYSGKEVQINVLNPDDFYAGNTLCVSASGEFSECPSQNADDHFTNISAALDSLFANDGPRRLLVRRGEDYIQSCSGYSYGNLTGPFYLGPYGQGAKPVFRREGCNPTAPNILQGGTLMRLRPNVKMVTIEGINFQGEYDASTGFGDRPRGFDVRFGSEDLLFLRNSFSGLRMNLLTGGSSGDRTKNYYVVDNHITNWSDYGHYGSIEQSAFLGNSIRQKDDVWNSSVHAGGRACKDDMKVEPCPSAHGPIRLPSPKKSLIAFNDMFSANGWSSSGKAHQPNIRLAVDSYALDTVVSDNLMEGGFSTANLGTSRLRENGFHPDDRVIFERNRVTASPNTQTLVSSGKPGRIIRNNVFLKLNDGHQWPSMYEGQMQGLGESEFGVAISIGAPELPNHMAFMKDIPTWISGNTFVVLDEARGERSRFLRVSGGDPEGDPISYSLNNIMVNNNVAFLPFLEGKDSTPRSGFIEWRRSDTEGLISNNNSLFAPGYPYFGVFDSVGLSLSEWQTLNYDSESFEGSPEFVDADAHDFRPSQSSPLINKGIMRPGFLEDKKGISRPQGGGVDLGAFEYIPF